MDNSVVLGVTPLDGPAVAARGGPVLGTNGNGSTAEHDGQRVAARRGTGGRPRPDAGERLRRVEHRVRALLELAPAAIVGLDAAGRVRLANDRAAAMFGCHGTELVGQSFDDLVPGAWRGAPVPGAVTGSAPLYPDRAAGLGEFGVRRSDGGRFPVTVSFRPAGGDDQVAVLASVCDLSERQRETRERARLEEALARAERLESVGQLAGGIAHDFNNLLAVIINYSEFVFQAVGPEVRDDVAPIRLAATRAADLVRQLLQFSRGQPAAPERLEVHEVLGGIRELLERTIGEHLTLRMALSPRTPPVLIDRSKLEQVVVNLVVNARDAMPDGGPIEVETGAVEFGAAEPPPRGLGPGLYARLTVRDAGSGMTEAVQDHAFDPFFTTKPQGRGTGLGLATVYGIVTDAGGQVSLTSQLGSGTAVCIHLPAAPSAVEAPALPEPAGASGPGHGETVLVVEDEPAVLGTARRILERNSYVVLPASGPGDALELSRSLDAAPDLLLSDVVMPGMSGPELTEELRARWPDLAVLMMSGYPDGERPEPPGAFEVVEKPFTESELLGRIEAVLRTAR